MLDIIPSNVGIMSVYYTYNLIETLCRCRHPTAGVTSGDRICLPLKHFNHGVVLLIPSFMYVLNDRDRASTEAKTSRSS